MLEQFERSAECSKADFDAAEPGLRVDLLNVQTDLHESGAQVLIVIAGDDRLATEEMVDLVNEWMDARLIDTESFERPDDTEQRMPRFWRFWRVAPTAGRIALFHHAWATSLITQRLLEEIDDDAFERGLRHAAWFEREMVAGAVVVLKFWLHLPDKARKSRLKRARRHPRAEWQIEERDFFVGERIDEIMPLAERLLRATDTPGAPWHIVESSDDRHRDLTVMTTIRDALQRRAQQPAAPSAPAPPPPATIPDALDAVELDRAVPTPEYNERLERAQERLHTLSLESRRADLSSVLVFEGWDAAGKGGAIRRLTRAMPARNYRVVRIAAPTEEERARHYLWRFWRRLPLPGRMTIFDRSWYGRVLVERVEGFAREDEWRRAYAEIVDFEAQLVEHGVVLCKFWLHIDADEQQRRFEARAESPYKKHKLTPEDHRNRKQRPAYEAAVNEMLARTVAPGAPWTLVGATDKRWARLRVLDTVCDALEAALSRRGADH
ncbi:MAG: polyphosphate:AMP phosphotransferase [Phycisphaerales bacterium]